MKLVFVLMSLVSFASNAVPVGGLYKCTGTSTLSLSLYGNAGGLLQLNDFHHTALKFIKLSLQNVEGVTLFATNTREPELQVVEISNDLIQGRSGQMVFHGYSYKCEPSN